MPRPPFQRGAVGLPRPYVCNSCLHRSPRNVRALHANTLARKEKESAEWEATAQRILSGQQPSMLSILEARGFIKDIAGSRADLDTLLTNKRTAAYVGIDPTAPSLHLGHLLPLMILFHLYIHGYKSISLLGAATASIGDPTGRLSSRADMDMSEKITNLTGMQLQVRGLWRNLHAVVTKNGYKKDLAWSRAVLNNSTWLGQLGMIEFLGTLGRGMRMGVMMGRDTVKNKMTQGDGMSFAEFTYPLLQAWDWWHMYSTQGVQLQIGGSDQYGNIVAGMDAIKYIQTGKQTDSKELDAMNAPYGITTPLLTTSSGAKFGKSAGNAVWLDKDMTSPFDLYGFLVRSSDTDVHRYLKLFTFLTLEKIEAVMEQHLAHPNRRTAQHLLAREVLELIHGPDVARQTAHQHRIMRKPTLSSLTTSPATSASPSATESTDAESEAMTASVERVTLPRSLVTSTRLGNILYHAGLVSTKSEGSRMIRSGGAYIGGNTTWHSNKAMDDSALTFRPMNSVTAEIVDGYIAQTDGVLVLRIGKWKVRVIKIVDDGVFEAQGLSCAGWDEFKRVRDEAGEVEGIFMSQKEKNEKKGALETKEELEKDTEESNVVDLSKPSPDGKWRNTKDMFARVEGKK